MEIMGSFCSKLCSFFSGFHGFEVCSRGKSGKDGINDRSGHRSSSCCRGIESQPLLSSMAENRDEEEGTTIRYGSILRKQDRTGSGRSFKNFFIASANSSSSTNRVPQLSINQRLQKSKIQANDDKSCQNPYKSRFQLNGDDEEIRDENESEEQKLLISIVEETALNMINVNECYGDICGREARVRSYWYAKKLEKLSPNLLKSPSESKLRGRLLSVLSSSSKPVTGVTQTAKDIAQEDADLMNWATEEVSQALLFIRVPTEELDEFVIPFPS